MRIPHLDEQGHVIGEVDIPQPQTPAPHRNSDSSVHDNAPDDSEFDHAVLPMPDHLVADVRMHELPEFAGGTHLAVAVVIAVGCVAVFAALLWVVLGR